MVTTEAEVTGNIAALRKLHAPVLGEVYEGRKRLRRGFTQDGKSKLRINDPVTLFNFALHLVSSRDIRWLLPSVPQDNKEEIRKNGAVERVLTSVLYQNNVSRAKRGLPRIERAAADPALEQAKTVIYKERRGDEFRIDPIDPLTVYERFDDRGLAEVVHIFTVDAKWVTRRAQSNPSWVVPENYNSVGNVEIQDYWEYNPVSDAYDNWIMVNSATRLRNISSEPKLLFKQVAVPEIDMPFEIQYFFGEAFSGGNLVYKGRSILDANSQLYEDKHVFMNKLSLHMDEVLTSPANAGTIGGRPIDPSYVDPTKGNRPIYTHDPTRGESAISFSSPGPLDASTQFLDRAFDRGIQAGGISDIFLGNLNFPLSGFAISELEELTLSSVGEVAIGLEFLWSRIGNWVLSSLETSPPSSGSLRFTGFTASLANDSFFSDDFKVPGDLPKNLNVAAKIDIAMPSDLTERVNLARQLDPTSGPIWSPRNIGEVLFPREIPDVQGNMDEIREHRTEQLPQIQLMETYAGLKFRLEKLRESEESEDREFMIGLIEDQLEFIKQSVAPVQNQPARQGTGELPQGVQPAEARGQGRAR